jgi:acetylornithine deacetylase/succinyl-diaminopimelate desuccinylase-like protein
MQQPARIPAGWSRKRYIDDQADMMSEAFDKAAEFAHERFVQSGSGAFFGTLWKEIGNALTDPHVILDGVGMIPGLGEPADLLNAGLYAAEGNYAMAGLSLAAAVPIAGYAANALKTVKRLENGVEAVAESAQIVRWGPATGAGPLGEDIAKTFRGASYTEHVTEEATTLYRAYGGDAGELSSYWSRTPPSGPLQAKMDSALKAEWGNTATSVSKIEVPRGTRVFEGSTAPQGHLMGGGNQVVIPHVPREWLR